MNESIRKHLWRSWWHAKVEIIPDWMPNFPREETKPKLVVRYGDSYLRHSAGPRQGFFWDTCPDAMHSEELAVIAIAAAPTPSLSNLMKMEGYEQKEMRHNGNSNRARAAANRVLRNPENSKASKTAAGLALTQRKLPDRREN